MRQPCGCSWRRSERERVISTRRLRVSRAGLARQNDHIIALERENADLRRLMGTQQTLVRGLTEQNALVRQGMAVLRQQDAHRRGDRLGKAPDPEPEVETGGTGTREKDAQEAGPGA